MYYYQKQYIHAPKISMGKHSVPILLPNTTSLSASFQIQCKIFLGQVQIYYFVNILLTFLIHASVKNHYLYLLLNKQPSGLLLLSIVSMVLLLTIYHRHLLFYILAIIIPKLNRSGKNGRR